MDNMRRYPVGIQTFEEIRNKHYVYVDKTALVHRLANSSKYIFLSRPRRFGKSLLVSTLKSYFEGRSDLFRGLAAERLETEWAKHPVLHFDMSTAKHTDKAGLEAELNVKLLEYEDIYGKREGLTSPNQRLESLIKRTYEKTGMQVVVLIDEYDAPLLDVVHEEHNLPELRQVMRNFYSPLKSCDPYLRFVFLTGITKFSQLSIFSELNNIRNVSMLPEYATICGITQEELCTQMDEDLAALAARLGSTKPDIITRLKENYDGYHFTWPSPDIYNPFSLVNVFLDGVFSSYWFGSGTPTYLIEMLRKFRTLPSAIDAIYAKAGDFDAPTENMESTTPLLYQSGYITIRDYDARADLYTLGIPNREVRTGLYESLLGNYLTRSEEAGTLTARMGVKLMEDDLDGALELMQKVFSTLPYCDNTHYEGHFQQMLFLVFSLLGTYVDVEVRTPRGRVDMVMRTQKRLYLIELKVGKSADAAMRQIDLKQYAERFALCGLPRVKVGIDFDVEARTLSGWKIEEVKQP